MSRETFIFIIVLVRHAYRRHLRHHGQKKEKINIKIQLIAYFSSFLTAFLPAEKTSLYMFHLSSHLDDAHRRVQIQYAKMDFIEMPRLLDQIR